MAIYRSDHRAVREEALQRYLHWASESRDGKVSLLAAADFKRLSGPSWLVFLILLVIAYKIHVLLSVLVIVGGVVLYQFTDAFGHEARVLVYNDGFQVHHRRSGLNSRVYRFPINSLQNIQISKGGGLTYDFCSISQTLCIKLIRFKSQMSNERPLLI